MTTYGVIEIGNDQKHIMIFKEEGGVRLMLNRYGSKRWIDMSTVFETEDIATTDVLVGVTFIDAMAFVIERVQSQDDHHSLERTQAWLRLL